HRDLRAQEDPVRHAAERLGEHRGRADALIAALGCGYASPDRVPVAAAGGSAVLRRDPLLSVQGSAPPDLADHVREAIPVRGTMRPAVGIAVVAMTLLTPSPRDLSAQDSHFGIPGLLPRRRRDASLRASCVLRGELERYRDEITSDGSVGDIRLAAASRLSRRLAIGAGIHILAGSTRMTAERRFDDSTFHAVGQVAEVRYDGF